MINNLIKEGSLKDINKVFSSIIEKLEIITKNENDYIYDKESLKNIDKIIILSSKINKIVNKKL